MTRYDFTTQPNRLDQNTMKWHEAESNPELLELWVADMDVAKRLASEPQNVAFSADVFRISRRSLLSELDIGTVRQFGPLFGLSHYLSFGLSPWHKSESWSYICVPTFLTLFPAECRSSRRASLQRYVSPCGISDSW